MRVLFINTLDSAGGAAGIVRSLMDGLSKKGHTCKLLVGYKKSKDENIACLRKVFGADIDFIVNNGINKIVSNDIDLGVKKELFEHPWYQEAEIVHLNNLHGGYFKLENLIRISKEKKVVWTFHDEWPIMAHGACVLEDDFEKGFYLRSDLATYPSMFFENKEYLINKKREIYNNSNFVITVPSKWIKGLVDQSILKDRRIELIHNGIEIKYFVKKDKDLCRTELGLPLDRKIILFVADGGVDNMWKGWRFINYKSKEYLFVIVGGKKVKITENVLSMGYVNNKNELAKYYNAADLLIMPSIVESFGNVAVEAMACGTPVVAFPVGVIEQIIKHKQNGYIAKYKDSVDFEKGIEWILKNETTVVSDEIWSKFSVDVMINKYLDVYKSL